MEALPDFVLRALRCYTANFAAPIQEEPALKAWLKRYDRKVESPWFPMESAPMIEGGTFLIVRLLGGETGPLVEQVSVFEGKLYPDAKGFNVDYGDRIEDADGWLPILLPLPLPLPNINDTIPY